jgi:hypothetical protein
MLININLNQVTCHNLWKEYRAITGWHMVLMEGLDYLFAHDLTEKKEIDGVLYSEFTYNQVCDEVLPMYPMPESQMRQMLLDMAKANLFIIPEETLNSNEDTLFYYAKVGPGQYALSFGDYKPTAV